MQHIEEFTLEGPWTANGSAISADCLVQTGQRGLLISVYSNLTHLVCSALVWFIWQLVLWGSFCSLQCLLQGFLSGCSLPCVGDELARHDVRWCQQWGNWVPGPTCSCPPCCHLYHRLNRLLGHRGTCEGCEGKRRERVGCITVAFGSWGCGPQQACRNRSWGSSEVTAVFFLNLFYSSAPWLILVCVHTNSKRAFFP